MRAVCLPFNIACGFCKNCERGLTGFRLTVNPGKCGRCLRPGQREGVPPPAA